MIKHGLRNNFQILVLEASRFLLSEYVALIPSKEQNGRILSLGVASRPLEEGLNLWDFTSADKKL